MNIRTTLLKVHSKENTLMLARYIGNNKKEFAELMSCLSDKDVVLNQRSAWVMRYCAQNNPDLVKPYLKKIIDLLAMPVHDAVKRNSVRILQNINIPASLQGSLANNLFAILLSQFEPVAIKAFSMTVLLQLCKVHPDLSNELKQILINQMPMGSPGYRSRAKKVLKELDEIYV